MTETMHTFVTTDRLPSICRGILLWCIYFCHDWQRLYILLSRLTDCPLSAGSTAVLYILLSRLADCPLSVKGVLLCYTYFCHDWQRLYILLSRLTDCPLSAGSTAVLYILLSRLTDCPLSLSLQGVLLGQLRDGPGRLAARAGPHVRPGPHRHRGHGPRLR